MIILIAINDADDDVDIDADIDVDVDADVVGFFDTHVLHPPLTLVGNIEWGVTFLPLEETTFQLDTCKIKAEGNSVVELLTERH